MEKRGLSHIEVILSFIIFVGFLIFAFYFFNPLKADRVLGASLYYVNDEIIENISIEVETYSVSLFETPIPPVVKIPLNATIDGDIKVRVESYEGNNLSSSYLNNLVTFETLGNNFVKVTFSEDFEQGSPSPGVDVNYTIASSDIGNLISEKRIKNLQNHYINSYNELRSSFNIPNRIDFGFSIIFAGNDSIVAEKEIPEGINVQSGEEKVKVIREDGRTLFADLIIKVW